MAGEQATDGRDPGQGANAPEAGAAGGETAGGDSKSDRLADMEARFEMLQDSMMEMRNAFLGSRSQGAGQQSAADDIDDDEPLTPSKVKKIVRDSVASVANANQTLSQRQQWDEKAKSEFPLSDPKFLLEFKKEWREQVEAGLNPNHPKAVYNVAKITARMTGAVKKATKSDAETAHTSEAPTTTGQRPASARSGHQRSTVSDDDPRLAFYAMKGNRTKEQLEAMKRKLGEKDAAKGARR